MAVFVGYYVVWPVTPALHTPLMSVTNAARAGAEPRNYVLVSGGSAFAGCVGDGTAKRIAMTALPQLVAAFHALVGLAAVFVACGAFVSPVAFGISYPDGHLHGVSL